MSVVIVILQSLDIEVEAEKALMRETLKSAAMAADRDYNSWDKLQEEIQSMVREFENEYKYSEEIQSMERAVVSRVQDIEVEAKKA